jgi:hypothetical protein
MEIESGLLHTMLITSAFILLGAFCWDLAKDIKELRETVFKMQEEARQTKSELQDTTMVVLNLFCSLSNSRASDKNPESSAAQASQNFEKLKFEFDSNSDS